MLRYILAVVLVSIVLYGLVEAWPLIAYPSLAIASPIDYASYPTGIVSVSGVAKRVAELTINGARILHAEDGSFETVLTFPRGGSILTFTVTDRFGRTTTATRNIFVSNSTSEANMNY